MRVGEGESSKGIFGGTATGGRAFRRWRKLGTIDRFAELLSRHDLEGGDPGGNVAECARKMGLKPQSGHAMLQRLRQRLGPQAR